MCFLRVDVDVLFSQHVTCPTRTNAYQQWRESRTRFPSVAWNKFSRFWYDLLSVVSCFLYCEPIFWCCCLKRTVFLVNSDGYKVCFWFYRPVEHRHDSIDAHPVTVYFTGLKFFVLFNINTFKVVCKVTVTTSFTVVVTLLFVSTMRVGISW